MKRSRQVLTWDHEMQPWAQKPGLGSQNTALGPKTWSGITKCGLGSRNMVWDHETRSGITKHGLGSRNAVWDH